MKEFARLKEKLEQGNFKAGKGTKYLPGSNGIYIIFDVEINQIVVFEIN